MLSRAARLTAALAVVRAYLPENYRARAIDGAPGEVLIIGHDVAGWTLDGYVIPRLASGLHFAREVTGVDVYSTPDAAWLVRPGESHSRAWHRALDFDPTTQD